GSALLRCCRLLGLSTIAGVKIGKQPWVIFQSAGWVNFQSAPTAATASGDELTAEACRAILKEEVAMADWLREHLPEITRAFLSRSATPGEEAKR
ncbi:DUF892 family protein, partial [Pseudomonas sp. ESBL2]|uniref:DUF892 family protein n=1 Tax=Pseudomonas sp. ESBL2 TaxID=3077325 RepID=UPI002FC76C2E